MKKVFLFFAVVAVFAACGPKAAKEEASKAAEIEVVEEVVLEAEPADSVAVQCTDSTAQVVAE